MDQQQLAIAIVVFNVLLALVAFFGGLTVREVLQSVKDLRAAHDQLAERQSSAEQRHLERLGGYVGKEEFREHRTEQRDLFRQMFVKLDTISETLSKKVDRGELQ